MITDDEVNRNPPFPWGEEVRVKSGVAPGRYRVTGGAVVGFTVVRRAELAAEFGVALGTILVLVERNDGEAYNVPADCLELYP